MFLVYYDKIKKRLSNSRNMILYYDFIIYFIFFDKYFVNILRNVVFKLNILKIIIICTQKPQILYNIKKYEYAENEKN